MTIRCIHTVSCVTLGGCTPFLLMFVCSDPPHISFLIFFSSHLSVFFLSHLFLRYVRWYAADGNASFVPAAAVLDVSICCASFDPSELLDVLEDRSVLRWECRVLLPSTRSFLQHTSRVCVCSRLLAAHVSVCVCVCVCVCVGVFETPCMLAPRYLLTHVQPRWCCWNDRPWVRRLATS